MKVVHKAILIGLSIVATVYGCSTQPPVENVVQNADIKIISPWPGKVRESSALASHAGMLWTLNDSGDKAQVYAIDTEHRVSKTVQIQGAQNIDWEEMAQDDEHLYIFDCGNNRGKRDHLQIYKTQWQDLQQAKDGSQVSAEVITFSYADKPEKVNAGFHDYDCEAVAAVGDQLWLFTKNRRDQHTNLYVLDKSKPVQSVQPQAKFQVKGLITAADYDPQSQTLVLLGYEKSMVFGQSFVWTVPVKDKPVWKQAKRYSLMPYGQWEAVKWDRSQGPLRLLLTTESTPLLSVSLGELGFPDIK